LTTANTIIKVSSQKKNNSTAHTTLSLNNDNTKTPTTTLEKTVYHIGHLSNFSELYSWTSMKQQKNKNINYKEV
jgi:hypothetical protein